MSEPTNDTTFQSPDHDELTEHIVIRPDGEPDNLGGETHYADNYDELAKPVIRPDGDPDGLPGETFYSDDYEALTGRERDGTVREGGSGSPVAEQSQVEMTAKVVTAPRVQPAKSSVVAETK